MARIKDAIWDGIRNKTGNGGGGGGRGGDNELKKGPWTPTEDALLVEYVMKNGAGKWNDLQRKGVLRRRGQSCRLRWLNHLRSNLKRGDLTPQEKTKIVSLHAEYGSRWSLIAHHLPGRTDNEIKNYWASRYKRRSREGLPIYPPEIQEQINHQHSFHPQPEKPPKSHIQHSSSSSSSSSPSLQNPSSSTMSLMDPRSNNPLISSMPLPQNLHYPSSPYIPLFDENRELASLGTNPIPHMGDAFLSQNFEIENPSIHSSFPAISPTFPSTNLINNFVLPLNVGAHSKEENQPNDDNFIMMNDPNNNMNYNLVSVPGGNYMKLMGASSSGFSLIDMGAKSQADFFEYFNMMNDDNCSWLDIPPNGPPKELDEFRDHDDDDYTEPTNASKGTIPVAINMQGEVLSSHVSLPNGHDPSSSFSPNDMGVISQADVFEDVNMTIDDNWRDWSWIDLPPTGPLNDLNQHGNDAIIQMEENHDWAL